MSIPYANDFEFWHKYAERIFYFMQENKRGHNIFYNYNVCGISNEFWRLLTFPLVCVLKWKFKVTKEPCNCTWNEKWSVILLSSTNNYFLYIFFIFKLITAFYIYIYTGLIWNTKTYFVIWLFHIFVNIEKSKLFE